MIAMLAVLAACPKPRDLSRRQHGCRNDCGGSSGSQREMSPRPWEKKHSIGRRRSSRGHADILMTDTVGVAGHPYSRQRIDSVNSRLPRQLSAAVRRPSARWKHEPNATFSDIMHGEMESLYEGVLWDFGVGWLAVPRSITVSNNRWRTPQSLNLASLPTDMFA